MAFKLDRNHKDYLFWIYPLIIMGLLIFAIKRDEHKREHSHAKLTVTNVKVDTSLTISLQTNMVDTFKTIDRILQPN
jgi:hypothetical protein